MDWNTMCKQWQLHCTSQCSSGQLVIGSFIMTRSWITSLQSFNETSNHPGDSDPLHPRFGALKFLAFPKTKITFKREEISDPQRDSGKYGRAADGNWENCVRFQGDYVKEDWSVIFLCTMFHISSSINVSIFHIAWLDTFWKDLIYFV